jgi:hypothetical protein
MARRALLASLLCLGSACLMMPVQSSDPHTPPAEGEHAGRPGPAAAAEPAPHGSAPAGAQPAASAPAVVSVTLVNRCSSTVPVFYGEKPGFSSGTQSSLSGNSRQSRSMRPGEQIWLTDDSRRGLGSVTISASTREVQVDCASITAR